MESHFKTNTKNTSTSHLRHEEKRATAYQTNQKTHNEQLLKPIFSLPALQEGIHGKRSVITQRDMKKVNIRSKNSDSPENQGSRHIYLTPPPNEPKVKPSYSIASFFENITSEILEDKEQKVYLCKKIIYENEKRRYFYMDYNKNEKMMMNAIKLICEGKLTSFEDFIGLAQKSKKSYKILEYSEEEKKVNLSKTPLQFYQRLPEDSLIKAQSKTFYQPDQVPKKKNLINPRPDNFPKSKILEKSLKNLQSANIITTEAFKNSILNKNHDKIKEKSNDAIDKSQISLPLNADDKLSKHNIIEETKESIEKLKNSEKSAEKSPQKSCENIENLTDIEEVNDSIIINSSNGEIFIDSLLSSGSYDIKTIESLDESSQPGLFPSPSLKKTKESPLKNLMNKVTEEIAEIPEHLEENSEFLDKTSKEKNHDSLESDSSSSSSCSNSKKKDKSKNSMSISSDLYKSAENLKKIHQNSQNLSVEPVFHETNAKENSNLTVEDKNSKENSHISLSSSGMPYSSTQDFTMKKYNFTNTDQEEKKIESSNDNENSKGAVLLRKSLKNVKEINKPSRTQGFLEDEGKKKIQNKRKTPETRKFPSEKLESPYKISDISKDNSSKDISRQMTSNGKRDEESSRVSDTKNTSSVVNNSKQSNAFEGISKNLNRRNTARTSILNHLLQRESSKRQSIQNIQNTQNIQNIQNIRNIQGLQKSKSFIKNEPCTPPLNPKAMKFIENSSKLVLFCIIKLTENPECRFTREPSTKALASNDKSLLLYVTLAKILTGTYNFSQNPNKKMQQIETDDIDNILNTLFQDKIIMPTNINIDWPSLKTPDPEKITPEALIIKDSSDLEAEKRIKMKLKFLYESKSSLTLSHTEKMKIIDIDDSIDLPKQHKMMKDKNSDMIIQEIMKMKKKSLKRKIMSCRMIRACSTHNRCKEIK